MCIQDLPDGLKTLLGDLSQFLNLELNKSSKLAQANTEEVLIALLDQGYYLQMPPGDQLLTQIPGSGFIQ